MAGEIAINTAANPAYLPPGGSSPGVIPAIVVADEPTLAAIVAGSVPTVCQAFVRSVKTIFLTEDAGATWNAY